MDHIGIDLHKRESQICWLSEDGQVNEQRIQTRRERFEAVLGGRAPAQVLIEASTESEWVARCLEELGHRVIVVDPNYAPMYPRRTRRLKNDRRDALALAMASRQGNYQPVHRVSAVQQQVRHALTVRESLVRTRTRLIALTGALIRGEGLRVRSGDAERFAGRVNELALPTELRATLTPLLALLEAIEDQLAAANARVTALVKTDPRVQRLQSVPHIGPITSAAFVSTLDTPTRFRDASQVVSYLGLVPRQWDTGDRHRPGPITKLGPTRLRYLLVQAAWGILGSRFPDGASWGLRHWADEVARRRGSQVAAVALARRLARILFAMLRDGSTFEPTRTADRRQQSAA